MIYYLIKGLKEAGHQPVLLGPADSKVDCERIPTIDRAIGFSRTRTQTALAKRKVAAYTQRTRSAIERLLPTVDVIHSHGFDLSGFEKFPNLTTVHDEMTLDNLDHYLNRPKLNYAAISENQRKAFENIAWVGTAPNGEDPTDFAFKARPQNYVCFLGRMDEAKCPHLAILLALKLGIKIKLAGKIDHYGRKYFSTTIKPYLRHPLVDYLGELDFRQKVDLLRNAKCNLHPTNFREPFGLTIIEAAYVGTPTLAIRRGAIPELIEDGKTGILVEDFVEAYSQIKRCFRLDRNYVATATAKRFNYQRMAQHYIKLYKAVIKKAAS